MNLESKVSHSSVRIMNQKFKTTAECDNRGKGSIYYTFFLTDFIKHARAPCEPPPSLIVHFSLRYQPRQNAKYNPLLSYIVKLIIYNNN